MSMRVLNRRGAREITPEELDQVPGAISTCFITACRGPNGPGVGDDVRCDT
jgi:hypothetical protein